MVRRFCRILLFLLALALLGAAVPAFAAEPVVRAVLFYSPSCPHCHDVIDNDLPPLIEQYGEQLEIVGINTAHPDGQSLYQAAVQQFAIPQERLGVPCLIIGDRVLVGSVEIPQYFPGLVESHLAEGGVDWPAIPGLADLFVETPVEPTPAAAEQPDPTPVELSATGNTSGPAETAPSGAVAAADDGPPATTAGLGDVAASFAGDSVADRFRRDLAGNSLAVVVLAGMVLVVVASFRRTTSSEAAPGWQSWAILVLVVAGLAVSAYMTVVETTGAEAVCGPVGDCNTVQQSSYATLFGFLPVGVLGLIGYAVLGVAWLAAHLGRISFTPLVLMAFGGTLFSIYLTFLEPFVIGATCLWCLSSAVIITLILLLGLRRAPLAA
jgi:uncharacterized membrane protein